MTDLLDRARGALHAQPFSMLLGAELMQASATELTLCLPIRDELRQQHGFVHGGVISYLADNALTFAGALALGPRVVTGEYKINYLRPAMNGTLVARAQVVYAGRHQATCQCDVFVMDGGRERLIAVAQGTINRIGDGGESVPAS
ncbi:uncharacterized protein (TIGR00369 family) [Paraburkholderia sp. GAS41]|jgi:uncharacterized protein (TIGR00369 family)|uniref:PaaI family thioesterase n=1 Tax=Paraburkholderia sp. GAS41 TaxID=3035134 RepID=UPI003D23A43A